MSYRFSLVVAAFVAVWTYFVVVPRYPSVAARIGPWTATQGKDAVKRIASSRRVPVPDAPGVLQVTLLPGTVERIDVRTVALREDKVLRTRAVPGEVMTLASAPDAPPSPAASTSLVVRVLLPGAADLPADAQAAKILPLAVQLDSVPVQGAPMGLSTTAKGPEKVFYYLIDAPGAVRAGQRVRVELPLGANNGVRKIVPYSAVVYDPKGGTWVFTNPQPLTFIRRPVKVDYVDGDFAYLLDGPAVGTVVVIAGAMELFGAESGVGH